MVCYVCRGKFDAYYTIVVPTKETKGAYNSVSTLSICKECSVDWDRDTHRTWKEFVTWVRSYN